LQRQAGKQQGHLIVLLFNCNKKEMTMLKDLFAGTIVDGKSGQDGLEYVALAAIILVVLVVVGRLIAQKLQEGGEAATGW
jgi:hypothetical protein